MTEASDNQFELESGANSLDAQSEEERVTSASSNNGSASEFSSDDSSLLTKVADLLDDVTETDPYSERSLDPTMPYNDRTGHSQSTGDTPSLNSTWRPASSPTPDSKSDLASDGPSETAPEPTQHFGERTDVDAPVSDGIEHVTTQAPPHSTDVEKILDVDAEVDGRPGRAEG